MERNHQVHQTALCESGSVGAQTTIGSFVDIQREAVVGHSCRIGSRVFIDNGVWVGDNVTIESGAHLCNGLTVEDCVIIGPNVTFTNVRYPSSGNSEVTIEKTIVRKDAAIGANAAILSGLEIGLGAMIGAGAVVTRSVPPSAIVAGNPARIIGYTNNDQDKRRQLFRVDADPSSDASNVNGVAFHVFPHIKDMRGNLSVGEFERSVPFAPKRYFLIFDVPGSEIRGEHAHHSCHQFLICVKGSCAAIVDDGINRQEYLLDAPSVGLYMPPMTWGTQCSYSGDAVLLVFASEVYDPADYIRDYSEFKLLAKRAHEQVHKTHQAGGL